MTTPPPEPPESGHDNVERVDNLLDAVGELTAPLTGQQRAALWLAAGVFLLILGTTVFVLSLLWADMPPPLMAPKPATGADLAAYTTLVEQHNLLANAAYERARNIFQTIIASALIPVFTGIIGFIFGRERAA